MRRNLNSQNLAHHCFWPACGTDKSHYMTRVVAWYVWFFSLNVYLRSVKLVSCSDIGSDVGVRRPPLQYLMRAPQPVLHLFNPEKHWSLSIAVLKSEVSMNGTCFELRIKALSIILISLDLQRCQRCWLVFERNGVNWKWYSSNSWRAVLYSHWTHSCVSILPSSLRPAFVHKPCIQ